MNFKNKKAIAFVIVLFLLVAFEILYIFSELYNEVPEPQEEKITDAIKFKEEYEILNGKEMDGSFVRAVSINNNNPFIYSNEEDIIERINNKESFVVFFGYPEDLYSRIILEDLIKSAKDNGVSKIYYVNISNIRSEYTLNENHKVIKIKDGTAGYYELLKKLKSVLKNYPSLTYKTKKGIKKVKVDEKRIESPSVIVFKEGKAVALETGILDEIEDPHMEIEDSVDCIIKERFNCLFDNLSDGSEMCNLDNPKC